MSTHAVATRLTALLVGLATLLLTFAFAGAASATSAPVSQLACGNGIVHTNAPVVAAQQAFNGSDGYAKYYAELLRWNATAQRWVTLGWQGQFAAQVMSNDYNLGGTTGYAGPTWYNASGVAINAVRWTVSTHGYYAIRNWTADPTLAGFNPSWTTAIAQTSAGMTYCYA